jgi:hypothetical protein
MMTAGIARVMDPEKFAKVLALAESEHHGEAQSALRAARIMLARAGLSFRDLAAMARQREPHKEPPRPEPPPAASPADGVESETLRRQIRTLEQRVQEMDQALARERGELARQRLETKRWHQLARETAEQLWDVGKALEGHHHHPDATDKRQALIDLLRDPATADWSDREIARRIGTTPHAVGYWRRRLALAERTQHLGRVQSRSRRLFRRLSERTIPDGVRHG